MIAELGVGYQLTAFFVAWMTAGVAVAFGVGWLIRRFPPDDLVAEVERHPETRVHDVCSMHWNEKQDIRRAAGLEPEPALVPLAQFNNDTREWEPIR